MKNGLGTGGIVISNSRATIVKGNNITDNYGSGVWLTTSDSSSVIDNIVARNTVGIYLESNGTVRGNKVVGNEEAIQARAVGINVIGNMVANNSRGIHVFASIKITQNIVSNNLYFGIWAEAWNITIDNNKITNHTYGLQSYGILLDHVTNNMVLGNYIAKNDYGISLAGLYAANFLINNTLVNNQHGISLSGANKTNIYHNNFINNTIQTTLLYSYGSKWDNGYPSGGNYWTDYVGVDSNRDGIGDTPYFINIYDQDNYPLKGMFHSFNTSLDYHVEIISNSTIEDFMYFASNHTIRMYVSNTTTSQIYGFCRVSIPHALMNEYNVTINGATPYYANYDLYDNSTHRWIYFSYQHSSLEIIIVPEFSSLLILPIFMMAMLLIALFYKKHQHDPT